MFFLKHLARIEFSARLPTLLVGLLVLPFSPQFGSHQPIHAQSDCRLFNETGKAICGRFLVYWEEHGGLAQQGYPLSDELQEDSGTDGRTYKVQYFERALFEYHQENVGTPYDVLLSLLGSRQYKEYYDPLGAPNQHPNNNNPRLFTETHHRVGGVFRDYWEAHDGLAQQGFPISDEFQEVSALDGKTYTVQYFQRAVFELHPENMGTPFQVLLSPLGAYSYHLKYGTLSIPPPIESGAVQSGFISSETYLLWWEVNGPSCCNLRMQPSVKVVSLDFRTNRTRILVSKIGYHGTVRISGAIVFWESLEDFCRYCMFQTNLATGDTQFAEKNQVGRIGQVQAGRNITWLEADPQGERVMIQNLDSGVTDLVTSAPYIRLGYPRISDRYVVWSDSRYGEPDGNKYYLWAYSIESHTVQKITEGSITNTFDYPEHALSGHYLVWNTPALYLADIDNGETVQLYDKASYNIIFKNDMVAWTADNTIWGLKLNDRTPRAFASVSGYPRFIIAKNWLVWSYDTIDPPPHTQRLPGDFTTGE